MLYISRPVICEKCGLPIKNYSLNNTTHLLDFRCSCKHIMSLSESDYVKKVRVQSGIKTV